MDLHSEDRTRSISDIQVSSVTTRTYQCVLGAGAFTDGFFGSEGCGPELPLLNDDWEAGFHATVLGSVWSANVLKCTSSPPLAWFIMLQVARSSFLEVRRQIGRNEAPARAEILVDDD